MSHRLFSSPLQVLVLRDYKTHYVCSRTHTHSLQNKRWKGKQHKLCWQQADTSDCRSVSESLSADTLTLTQHDCEQVQAQGMTQIQSACQESNHRLTAQQRETRGGEGRRTGEKGRDDWVNTSTSQQETRVRQLTSLFTGQIYDRLVKELTVFSCHICSWHVKRIELMLKRCLQIAPCSGHSQSTDQSMHTIRTWKGGRSRQIILHHRQGKLLNMSSMMCLSLRLPSQRPLFKTMFQR